MRVYQALFAVTIAALNASAQLPDFPKPTPLLQAVMDNNITETRKLLAAGNNPNQERYFLGLTPLTLAATTDNAALVGLLLEKGADPNTADAAGNTPLLWAALGESGSSAVARELLRRGADVKIANKRGDTPLSLALQRGHTPLVELLKQSGADDGPMVKASVEKAIALLQKSAPQFVKVSGCSSCHHQSLPQMANNLARERGFAVDPAAAAMQTKTVLAMFKPVTEPMRTGKINLPDPAISVTYSLLGLAADNYPADDTTTAMAMVVAREQNPDGSFRSFAIRPPMESSVITATALSLRSLQIYGKEADNESRVEKARGWLLKAQPHTGEERAMLLLGLSWAKADAAELKRVAQPLLAEQRPDGGWTQLPGLESDAYATGQALVALQTSGQAVPGDPSVQRGMTFLLRTQLADGSWHVRTRALPVQMYKESGFPHGKDQWISAAGTSWAAMALSLTVPAQSQSARLF